MCDDRDKTVVTEMSEGGGGKGGLKLNGKLCTSIKTCGEDIKSYTPVPGDRMQEGGMQCKATVQSESQAFSPRRRVRKGGKGYRTARFNNVLGISVQECTIMCKIHGVIHQLQNEPKTKE